MFSIDITRASTQNEFETAKDLFQEYIMALGVGLSFQNVEAELNDLVEMYRAPSGCLLIGKLNERIAGCGAFRRASVSDCEMKRLNVRPDARGHRPGWKLAHRLILEARKMGYHRMILDTLPTMQTARSLYRSIGFV